MQIAILTIGSRGDVQPYVALGRRVEALGVGPGAIPRSALTVEKLAYALRVAASHAPMRQRAAALGQTLRAEDGTAQAVKCIERAV